jgi:hypothetical protein
MNNTTASPRVNLNTLWWATLVAAMGSVIANVIFLFIYEALAGTVFVPDPTAEAGFGAVGPLRVAIFTFVPGLGAGVLLWLLDRFTQNPFKIFFIVAGVFLVISLIPDILITNIEGITWSSAIGLMVMHFISAAIIVGTLRQFAQK